MRDRRAGGARASRRKFSIRTAGISAQRGRAADEFRAGSEKGEQRVDALEACNRKGIRQDGLRRRDERLSKQFMEEAYAALRRFFSGPVADHVRIRVSGFVFGV